METSAETKPLKREDNDIPYKEQQRRHDPNTVNSQKKMIDNKL